MISFIFFWQALPRGACSESVDVGLRVPALPSRDKHVSLVSATRDGRHSQSHAPRGNACLPAAVVHVLPGAARSIRYSC